jgi:hypothetical protein
MVASPKAPASANSDMGMTLTSNGSLPSPSNGPFSLLAAQISRRFAEVLHRS